MTGRSPAKQDAMAEFVIARLEEAGRTLYCLPRSGGAPKLRTATYDIVRSAAEVALGDTSSRIRMPVPSSSRIDAMDEAFGWLSLIPQDRYVLRRLVGARALVDPTTDRHLFSWRRLAGMMGADHRAVPKWHAEGIGFIVAALRTSASGYGDPGRVIEAKAVPLRHPTRPRISENNRNCASRNANSVR